MNFKGRQDVIQYGLVVVLVLPVLLAAVKTIQLLFFYDADTGMLELGGAAAVLQWVVGVGVAIAAGMGIWMAAVIRRASGFYRLGSSMMSGIGFFVAGLLFLGQTAADLLAVMTDRRLKIGGPLADIGYLQVAVSAAGLIAAVALVGMAYAIIASGRRPNALMGMVPAAWCVLFMLNLLYTYENLVSMQDNAVKTLTGVLALLFLYYIGRSVCGLDNGCELFTGIIVRLLFPGIGFVSTVPYCVAYLFGVKDRVGNMPYLALAGLSVFAAVSLIQLCRGAVAGLRRQARQESERAKRALNG